MKRGLRKINTGAVLRFFAGIALVSGLSMCASKPPPPSPPPEPVVISESDLELMLSEAARNAYLVIEPEFDTVVYRAYRPVYDRIPDYSGTYSENMEKYKGYSEWFRAWLDGKAEEMPNSNLFDGFEERMTETWAGLNVLFGAEYERQLCLELAKHTGGPCEFDNLPEPAQAALRDAIANAKSASADFSVVSNEIPEGWSGRILSQMSSPIFNWLEETGWEDAVDNLLDMLQDLKASIGEGVPSPVACSPLPPNLGIVCRAVMAVADKADMIVEEYCDADDSTEGWICRVGRNSRTVITEAITDGIDLFINLLAIMATSESGDDVGALSLEEIELKLQIMVDGNQIETRRRLGDTLKASFRD